MWRLPVPYLRTIRGLITSQAVREVGVEAARREGCGRARAGREELAAEGKDPIRQGVETSVAVHVRAFAARWRGRARDECGVQEKESVRESIEGSIGIDVTANELRRWRSDGNRPPRGLRANLSTFNQPD